MWIINDDGFFSAVQDWDKTDWLFVRSRSETDLQSFVELVQGLDEHTDWAPAVVNTPERDYQWRVHTPREVWEHYLAAKARNIDYGNFKSHCADKWYSEERDWASERLAVLNDGWRLFNHWPNGEPPNGRHSDRWFAISEPEDSQKNRQVSKVFIQ